MSSASRITGASPGLTKKGWHPNSLTPVVGDANTETPEFKAWLVNIEPTTPPSDAVA